MNKINLFFAIDDNYCPFLSSAVHSILKNANKEYRYDIYVLHNGINENNQDIIKAQIMNDASIEFVDMLKFISMKEKLDVLADKLVTRDYYTKTTYYRLFIPNMFPNLDKALYLDVDIIVPGDISELYNTDLGDNLVGAVPDMAVQNTPVFIDYVENALGVKAEKYFNAGILLMNLKEMREWNFEEKFIELLGKYSFRVAQDQDYLNVICKGHVVFIDETWNEMPLPVEIERPAKPSLIHYNLSFKPWRIDGVLYEEVFWNYARKTSFIYDILETKRSYTKEMQENTERQTLKLMQLTKEQADDKEENERIAGIIKNILQGA